jgi:hypothetical protein
MGAQDALTRRKQMSKFLYKLTDEHGNSTNQTHWSEGVRHEIVKELRDSSKPLCTKHYLHAYENPLVAAFMNPLHAAYANPILWQATGWVQKRDNQLKCGCFSLRTIQKIPLPVITRNQKVRAAIYCALTRPQSEHFKKWAAKWLAGEDRTAKAAKAALAAATATATAAAHAAHAAADAAYAAYAATDAAAAYAAATAAAYAAADAAAAAAAAHATAATDAAAAYAAAAAAAYAATDAAAAYAAADAAAQAAAHAANAANAANAAAAFNLIKILKRSIKEEAILDRRMVSQA